MTNPFQPKTINVPGLLSDDALQQQLKQFANAKNAEQNAAPPPTSALDMADKIKSEYLDRPAPPLRSVPKVPGMVPETRTQKQDQAIDVRSGVLSDAAAAVPVPIRDFVLGPIAGQLGEGGLVNQLGTLDTPEARQAEADKRAADALAAEKAITEHAKVREKLRGLTDEEAAALGMPSSPASRDEEALTLGATLDKAVVDSAAAKRKEAVAAVNDPTKQPTQKWWLDAMQRGVKGAAGVGLGVASGVLELHEMTTGRIYNGGDIQRSDTRALVDTIGASLDKMLPGDKARSKDLISQLGGNTGSMLGFMLAGYVGRAVGLSQAGATMAAGFFTGADTQYRDAEKFNGVGLQKMFAWLLGGGIGLSEAIPINRAFMRAEAATGGMVSKMLQQTAAESAEEFLQEMGQAFGQDVVARYVYDAKREFDLSSYVKQGLMGALSGGLAGAATSMLHDSGVTEQMSPEGYVPIAPADREASVLAEIAKLDSELATAVPELATVVAPAGVDGTVTPVGVEGVAAPVNENLTLAPATSENAVVPAVPDTFVPVEPAALSQLVPAAQDVKGVPVAVDESGQVLVASQDLFAQQSSKVVETPAFKNWFGDSKVVDEKGAPVVVYHGTQGDFSAFDKKKRGSATKASDAKKAFFFVSDPKAAEDYLPFTVVDGEVQKAPGSNIMPVYLKMENPAAWDWGGRASEAKEINEVIRDAKREGHDGVVIHNIRDNGFSPGFGRTASFYLAFEPAQIKSAFNGGNFDPGNPDILANRYTPVRGEPLTMFPERTDQSFDRWFGKSKVKNSKGEPKAVFHGTTDPKGFRVFDPNKVGKTSFGLLGSVDDKKAGFYFADSEKFAKTFAEQSGGKGKLIPSFLRAERPLDVRKDDNKSWDRLKAVAARAAEIDPSITNPNFISDRAGADNFWEVLSVAEGGDAVVQAAKDLGYDSIRMLEPNHDTRESESVWVVFDNTQIKSAEENTGAYDPSNPDIFSNLGTGSTRGPLKGEQTRPSQGIAANATAATPAEANLAKISRSVIELLDLTARQGRLTIKGQNVLGQYSRKQDVVRVKTMSDLSTIVHEGGHALFFDAGPALATFIKANEAELMKAATQLYGGDTNLLPRNEHIAEGFSEFFRVYTLNRAFVDLHYPTLGAQFDQVLDADAPSLRKGLDLVGKQFAAWLQLPSAQLLKNMIVPGQQPTGLNAKLAEIKEAGIGTWMSEVARDAVDASVNRYAGLGAIVTGILNKGQENTGKAIDLKIADDPRKLIQLAQNAGARAMVQTTDGVMAYRSTEPSTRGLREALLLSQGAKLDANLGKIDPVRQQDFAAYLVALRGIDEYRRLAEGKIERPPVAATLGDLQVTVKEMEATYGVDFIEAAKIVHEYGMGLWQKTYDAGLMSKETYLDGLERQFYAPLQRDMSDKKKSLGNSPITGGQSVVKRFRGSDRNIIDPMDVLMHKTFALEQNIAKNDVLVALAGLADKAGKAGALVERIPASALIGKQFSVKEVARQLTKDDTISEADAVDLMTILESSIEDGNVINMFRAEQASTAGENVLFYWEKGRLAALQLADGDLGADVVNVVNGLGRENLPMLVDLVAATSTAFRTAITSWPDFLAVNFIRDQMSAWILTDVGYKPFVTGLRGVGDEIRQRDWARQYNAAMGMMGGMNVASLHKARINRDISALRKKGYLTKAFNEGGITGAIKGLANVVELTETGTRLGVFRKGFERAKADGLTDWEASMEAAYTSMDMANFGLNGSRTLLFRKTIPFLNAQLQGLYKLMRTLGADEVRQRKGLNFALRAYFKSTKNLDLSRTEKLAIQTGRKAWVKMAALGLFSAALHFLFEDDPDYQEAGEYMRATGWVIPMGDGRLFYIPKPYELAIVANFTERALEASNGDPSAKGRFMRSLALNLVPPTSPPLIQLGVELQANKDFFTGQEIVPSYMQALAPQLQFNNYTSELAKSLGEITGMSPMKIDHVLSGLGASAYRDITSMTNALNPNRPDMDATDAPIMRRFVRDSRRGSAASKDFWGIASTLNGSLRSAEVSYKAFLEAGNEQAANQFLSTLDEDEQAYALLTTHFAAEAKKLNPYYRARQITTVVSAMRREMASDLGLDDTATKAGAEIKLTGKEKADVDEALSEYSRREMRNTLIAMNAPGWAGKKPIDTAATVELLGAVEPRVRDELERRIKKAKVYSFETVNSYWPEVKDRLLRDRENTFLKDVVSIAKVMQ